MQASDTRATSALGLRGASVFVTGAASGIGRATALHFARAGANVTLVDIDASGLEETQQQAALTGGGATSCIADVSDARDVSRAMTTAVNAFGPVVVAFNNAGIEGARLAIAECPDEDFDAIMRVNLRSIWLCMKAQIPAMLAAKRGSILNTASAVGLVGASGCPAYVASKHAIVGLTRATALDYAKAGIRVNCLCPGVVASPMVTERTNNANPELLRAWLDAQPVGRLGLPDEIAAAAVWLSSDAASFVTGHAFSVDGGYVAR
jgi:NAD(P)-dependent dehydrogenase (short-subunit alcohol dehydrogenase family)